MTDASPSQTEPAEPDGGAEQAPQGTRDGGPGPGSPGPGSAPDGPSREREPKSPRWSERQPEPAPWYVGRPGAAPRQPGWGVAGPPRPPAPPGADGQPAPGQWPGSQGPYGQSPYGPHAPGAGPRADSQGSNSQGTPGGPVPGAGKPAADKSDADAPADSADASAEQPEDSVPEAPIAPPQPPQNPYGQPGPYGPQPPSVPPWHDPHRYGQPQRQQPPGQQQDDPWQRRPRPEQPAPDEPRGPLDLRTRWARGLALGSIVCTLASIWYSISNFPTWMIGAGAGLALGLTGLWLGVFAQRAALAKGKRAPVAVRAIVWGSIGSLLSLMILAFSLIFYTQLSQLSNCMRSATTIAQQNQCETNFQNEFGVRR